FLFYISLFSLLILSYTFFIFLFFLLTRPPPTSTLFPYTTLFRSRRSTREGFPSYLCGIVSTGSGQGRKYLQPTGEYTKPRHRARSEEHTSELQSRENLVCRLLLEKKKKKTENNYTKTTGDKAKLR